MIEFGEEAIAHLKFMNKVRYEEMEWIIRDTHELIYEGHDFAKNPKVIQAIQEGRDFRISLTLPDGREFRLDIDLLFHYPEKEESFGYTKTNFFPAICTSPQQYHDYCMNTFLGDDDLFDPEMLLKATDGVVPTLFWVYGDGTYANAFMQHRKEREAYQNLKIFASR